MLKNVGVDASLQTVVDVLQQRVIANLNNQLVVVNDLSDAVIGHLSEHFRLQPVLCTDPNSIGLRSRGPLGYFSCAASAPVHIAAKLCEILYPCETAWNEGTDHRRRCRIALPSRHHIAHHAGHRPLPDYGGGCPFVLEL